MNYARHIEVQSRDSLIYKKSTVTEIVTKVSIMYIFLYQTT